MAGPRQPTAVLKANGKKHLSKAEEREREATELKVQAPGRVRPPAWLPDSLKKDFLKYARLLIDLEIFCELDYDTLGRYLIAHQMYLKYTADLTKTGAEGDLDAMTKLSTLQDKAFKQARNCASDLGMTITSRCRLVVPEKKGPLDGNPILELLTFPDEGGRKRG